MSRKLIVSVMVLALALAAVGAGTYAYFSDTETSSGNSFTAGTVDLKINGQDDPVAKVIEVANVKPGDTWAMAPGEVILKNAGSIPAMVTYEIVDFSNDENGLTEPEVNAGDATDGDVNGHGNGELPAELMINAQENEGPGWTRWGGMTPLNNAILGQTFSGKLLQPGQSVPLTFWYRWDPTNTVNDNLAQSDRIRFGIKFHLDQVVAP